MSRHALLCLMAALPIMGCSSSEGSPAAAGGGAGTATDGAAQDATSPDAQADAPHDSADGSDSGGACLADGKFGKCSENSGCYCLKGATVYQFCTTTCQSATDCGDAASFPGATPGCYPVNPGSSQMICALVCSGDGECPCGLVCTASGVGSTKICAELQ